jgi:high-affinity nickel-transport protein
VAVFIGSVEALGLLSDQLGLKGKFWDLIGSLNDNLTNFGFVVVGIFLGSWLVSTLIYRVKGYGDLQAEQQR